MALVAGRTEIGLKDTTVPATIPNDNRAKLMYYLNCICSVLKLDDPKFNRLRQYQRYQLTAEETDELIVLCYLLSPDELIDKCIFHSDELCGDGGSNRFFDLSIAQTHLAVTNSVLIGGERKQVQSIMTYKTSWITYYWGDPIQALVQQRKREKERQQLQLADVRVVVQPSPSSRSTESSGCTLTSCCKWIVGIFIAICIIGGFIGGLTG